MALLCWAFVIIAFFLHWFIGCIKNIGMDGVSLAENADHDPIADANIHLAGEGVDDMPLRPINDNAARFA